MASASAGLIRTRWSTFVSRWRLAASHVALIVHPRLLLLDTLFVHSSPESLILLASTCSAQRLTRTHAEFWHSTATEGILCLLLSIIEASICAFAAALTSRV